MIFYYKNLIKLIINFYKKIKIDKKLQSDL